MRPDFADANPDDPELRRDVTVYYRDRDIAAVCIGAVLFQISITPAQTIWWLYALSLVFALYGGFGRGRTHYDARKEAFLRENPDLRRYMP